MKETFTKAERLCQKKLIQQLFIEGSSGSCSNLRFRWMFVESDNPFPIQILISVPTSLFHEATRRNLIKRRIREAYRKHKHLLYQSLNSTGRHMILAIIYTNRNILLYKEIQEKIILLLHRLIKENEKASG